MVNFGDLYLKKNKHSRINIGLAIRQKLTYVEINKILAMHLEENRLKGIMKRCKKQTTLRNYYLKWTQLQYRLQKLWRWEQDILYHRWWDLPGCTCPKQENGQIYPSKRAIYDGDCPMHGEIFDKDHNTAYHRISYT